MFVSVLCFPLLSSPLLCSPRQLSCGTCPICVEPEPIDGLNAIFQVVPLSDTQVAVWMQTKVDVNLVKGELTCASECVKCESPSLSS